MNTDHLEKLTLDNVGRLAGGIAADAIDRALAAALHDIARFPGDLLARKVVLTISLKPGKGRHLEVRFEAKPVILGRTPPAAAITAGDLGGASPEVLFNAHSATHLDQVPLPFEPLNGAHLEVTAAPETKSARKNRKGA